MTGIRRRSLSAERSSADAPPVDLPESLDAATTARWIESVLRGELPCRPPSPDRSK